MQLNLPLTARVKSLFSSPNLELLGKGSCYERVQWSGGAPGHLCDKVLNLRLHRSNRSCGRREVPESK
ncbi:hypothetical protein AAFF_G00363560 [Aldrovandia affinis]|uniref:Uncharacterized protein n=1 Tax=Aldrovandia affinis TaxID=143900 RepID=A0AAD7SHL5_9TELE|nr:hypothetical protein AAFF_G00363560 [Aldrovandia affinis]